MRDVVKSQAENVNNRHRRRRRRNLSLYYLLIFVIVIGTGIILSVTVLFNIKEIIVIGDTQYDDSQIINSSKISTGDNLVSTDFKKAEQNILKELVYIDSADIERSFPDKLIINVTASVEFANIENDNNYLVISKSEKILDIATAPRENLITIAGADPAVTEKGSTFSSKDSLKDNLISEILTSLSDCEFTDISKLDLSDTYNPILLYDNRINIELGTQAEMDYKIKYAKELVNAKISKKVKGTLFMRDNKTNEASFIEEEDLKRIKDGYTKATSISSSENSTEKTSESGQRTSEIQETSNNS